MRAPSLLLLVIIALSPTLPNAEAGPLEQRWRITTLAGMPADPAGDISFGDGQISGSTACNHFGGTYAKGDDGAIALEVGRMTRRACSGVAAERERAFLEAMKATRRYTVAGNKLELLDAKDNQLAMLDAAPDATLVGPRHKIVSYLKDNGLHSVPAGSGTHVTFADGRIEGSTGCTAFAGTYTIADPDKVRIQIDATRAEIQPCPPGRAE